MTWYCHNYGCAKFFHNAFADDVLGRGIPELLEWLRDRYWSAPEVMLATASYIATVCKDYRSSSLGPPTLEFKFGSDDRVAAMMRDNLNRVYARCLRPPKLLFDTPIQKHRWPMRIQPMRIYQKPRPRR